ncbi:MAG: UvrB/UvrC motif-containing protein [Pirellula sp.]|jgi:protein arginine kinase activator|nr:UvrB/UvrC motif-containing protein [Pirellula sp.]
MKCQHCEKPATFHITELTGSDGPKVLHLCEDHAREYLNGNGSSPATALSSMLAQQLKMDVTTKELAATDQKTCPVCGITFAEFRKGGRLGCAYDYVAFEDDLEPLLVNIHGALEHKGKIPKNRRGSPERQRQLAELREEMKAAIKKEEYEKAGILRDKIANFEANFSSESLDENDDDSDEPESNDEFQQRDDKADS